MSSAKVQIGIVSWNTAELLDRCLASLPAALDGLDAQIVVIDNASTDSSLKVAKSHSAVTVIGNESNLGYAKAMNQALRLDVQGEADVLVALNPDTTTSPGSIATLVDRLLAQPEVGLVAPRLINPDGSVQSSVYRFPSLALAAVVNFVPDRWQRGALGRKYWLEAITTPDEPVDVDWAIGAVHVIRAKAITGSSPYNERWFMYVEDLDLCWSLHRAGWRRRLEGDVAVTHVGNASGQIAWSERRTERWLTATYDWYALRHGHAAARSWAAMNTVGALVNLAPIAARRATGRPIAPWQRDIARGLKWHARAVIQPAGGDSELISRQGGL